MAHSTISDYDAPDTLVVSDPAQLRALGDEVRSRIVGLLRERATSASELAKLLEMPKGTVGHHLKVLERAGLVRVVRTRRVRAVTEKYYGRVARLFLLKTADEEADELVWSIGAASLRNAADELAGASRVAMHAVLHVRLDEASALRFNRRLDRLTEDIRAAETPEGEPWVAGLALFRMGDR